MHAQLDSVYKYVYKFSPPTPTAEPSIKIDSINHPAGKAAIVLDIKDHDGANIDFPAIWLKEENKNGFSFAGGFYKIDRTIDPGNYHITISTAGYEAFDTSFSIANKTTI